MNRNIAIYPGSFDPITIGHMDIIQRASRLYRRVVVAVLRNPDKRSCFTAEERVDMIERCCANLMNVEAVAFDGLTVDLARAQGATVMLRGLRAAGDFEAERTLAQLNQRLAPELETVLLIGRPEHSAISSSAARELASYGQSLQGIVPDEVVKQVLAHFHPASHS